MKKIAFIIFTVFVATLIAKADDIQFSASAPKVVGVGEQFEVTYSVSAQPSGFKPPVFKNFNLLGGPSTSSSSNIQIVNGKVYQNVSFSYTYYFNASTPGSYTLEPAKATVDGKTYSSNSLTIQVSGNAQQGGNQQGGGRQGNSQSQGAENQVNADQISNESIYIRVFVDRSNLYQGEHLVATIKIFTKFDISELVNLEYPSLNGFFRQDIETPNARLSKENVNGQVYYTAIINRFVLFPQKTGEITIDPCTFDGVFQIPVRGRSMFDEFFGPQAQPVRKKIKSLPVKIFVKPLPGVAPASYNGAVGNFSFKASLDKDHVKTNDAITLKLVVSGNGNLKVIEPLQIKFPSDFETYDPKVTVNTTVATTGVKGSKSFEYLIIPRHSGNFKISPIEFSYFDTQSNQYKTLSSSEVQITVDKGPNDNANSNVVSGVDKEDVRFIGKDIQFIKINQPEFSKKGSFLLGSLGFWLSYIISFLVFIVIVVLLRKQIKENANLLKVRNKRANKVAIKRLKDAHLFMKDNKKEEFYEYILKALWGYMSDKLSIPVSDLSRQKINEETANRNIDAGSIQKFLEIIDTCEFARYSPSEGVSQMDAVYADAIQVMSKIEQQMK
jgi:hypothetical protein